MKLEYQLLQLLFLKRAFSWITKKLYGNVSIPIIASNRINSPEIAEEVLSENCADLVSLARPFLADSDFVKKRLKIGLMK